MGQVFFISCSLDHPDLSSLDDSMVSRGVLQLIIETTYPDNNNVDFCIHNVSNYFSFESSSIPDDEYEYKNIFFFIREESKQRIELPPPPSV